MASCRSDDAVMAAAVVVASASAVSAAAISLAEKEVPTGKNSGGDGGGNAFCDALKFTVTLVAPVHRRIGSLLQYYIACRRAPRSSDRDTLCAAVNPPKECVAVAVQEEAHQPTTTATPDTEEDVSEAMATATATDVKDLNELELVKCVGEGGFGRVLVARRRGTSTPQSSPATRRRSLAARSGTPNHRWPCNDRGLFAVKSIDKRMLVVKRELRHVNAERRVLALCSGHPFIVGMHSAFHTAGHVHFVLDYCPGGEIFHLLEERRRFPRAMATHYAAEVLLALIHLHSKGVMYRDLKPENVVLDAEGHVRLVDFGLARDGMTDDSHRAVTFCGSDEYLAPELLARRGYGKSVDVWAFACFVFEMLTGLPPFHSGNNARSRSKLYQKILTGLVTYPRYVDETSRSLIDDMLAVDPAARLGSCAATGGWKGVMAHPFFAHLDWDEVLARKAPVPHLPPLSGPLDTRHFDSQFTSIPPELPRRGHPHKGGPIDHSLFEGFEWSCEPGAF